MAHSFVQPPQRLPAGVAFALLVAAVAVGCAGVNRPSGGRPGQESEPRRYWQRKVPSPASVGMPAGGGDSVAATWGHEWLMVLDGKGRPRWQSRRLGLRDVAPLVTDGLVLAATDEGLAAFDLRTGAIRWDKVIGERASTPVIVGHRAVVSTWEGSLVAFELADGTVAWRSALPGPSIGPPAGGAGTVVASWESEDGAGGGVVAANVDGALLWSLALAPGGISGPAVVDPTSKVPGGTVVVVAGDLAAHGIGLDTGRQIWQGDVDGAGSPEAPPAALPALGGAVAVATRVGRLVVLDATTGAVRWQGGADAAVVRGGPTGPGPTGRLALPLDDGRVLLAGPGRADTIIDPPGRVSGVATGPGGVLLIATREASTNHLVAERAW